MQEKNSSSATSAESVSAKGAGLSAEVAGAEHRQAYGTAKTENLRDNGLWRILLPGFVIASSIALIVVPMVILGNLLYTSLTAKEAGESQLVWLWISMIAIELALVGFIIWGLFKRFILSNNYAVRS